MVSDWRIPDKVAREQADEFAEGQRQAFLLGFKAAMDESESMAELREWAEEQRDDAHEQYDESGDSRMFARYLAYVDMLKKLVEMGNRSEDRDE